MAGGVETERERQIAERLLPSAKSPVGRTQTSPFIHSATHAGVELALALGNEYDERMESEGIGGDTLLNHLLPGTAGNWKASPIVNTEN